MSTAWSTRRRAARRTVSIRGPKKSKRSSPAATRRGRTRSSTSTRCSTSATVQPTTFHSLLDLGDCSANDLPLDQLTADLRKTEKTPNYSFIAPTLCNSGASGQCPAGGTEGGASADAFLAAWVPKILASPAYKADGLLIVNFGAANPPVTPAGAAAAPTSDSLPVGALLLSPFLPPGSTDAAQYDPYSIARSIEELFGLDPLGLAAASKTKSFAPSLLKKNGGD